ncbi:MAG: cyclic nucleotide-binding domain-containing protein [Acidimicrobiales bacterium]
MTLFENCSKKDLRNLASRTRFEQVEAGHTLLAEGSPSSNLYLLLAGTVSVRRNGRRIASLGAGDAVGELGVILGEARNATVKAETPVEMLVLDRPALRRAFDEVPGLGWKLLTSVAERLSSSSTAT